MTYFCEIEQNISPGKQLVDLILFSGIWFNQEGKHVIYDIKNVFSHPCVYDYNSEKH